MKKMNENETQSLYIASLREIFRKRAVSLMSQLSRSVARVTSYDEEACQEYGEEVKSQRVLAEKLLYVQQCRNALEQCIATGAYAMRYHWSNGSVTEIRFRKTSPQRGRVEESTKNLKYAKTSS